MDHLFFFCYYYQQDNMDGYQRSTDRESISGQVLEGARSGGRSPETVSGSSHYSAPCINGAHFEPKTRSAVCLLWVVCCL